MAQIRPLIKTMRPHQWSKNIVLFVPILLAHDISHIDKYLTLMIAFACTCLAASGVYIVNDLLDREADRAHPVKKNRPIASGSVRADVAAFAAVILLGAGMGGAFVLLNVKFALILLFYVFLTTAYSFKLKKLLVIDVITLSFFYTLRILSGGVAVDVPVSPWLLGFSWFFFLSLAFLKRYIELKGCEAPDGECLKGRSYTSHDSIILPIAGISSGLLSVLVFLLYITTSDQMQALYSNPLWLWMVTPVLVYWLMRPWFLAERNGIDCDPVTFALTDVPSWIAAVITGILLVLGAVT